MSLLHRIVSARNNNIILNCTCRDNNLPCFQLCRYPGSFAEFSKSRLPGVYNEELAGKRMKLPTPETWETQVSLKGNKASTWESLIGEGLFQVVTD